MLHFKPEVRFHPVLAMAVALSVASEVYDFAGYDCWITSANDGEHCDESRGRPCPDGALHSKHYDDRAIDLRITHVLLQHRQALVHDLTYRLGPQFQVLWEKRETPEEHIHIEWDPGHDDTNP